MVSTATLERLFHPYWRGNRSNPGAAGLGLGLYIASQIARSHKGELSVSSTDAGTVFRFRLALPATVSC
jgi:sigma-B regulation protein RsbU (phosphoserine phosphatase)